MKNKRGIGPLLATVILVAVVVAIGAIVGNYLIDKAEEFDPETLVGDSIYCDSVTLGYTADDNLNIGSAAGDDLIGPITLINRGSFSIQQLIISAPGIESVTRNILYETAPGEYEIGVIEPGNNNKYDLQVQFNSESDDKEIRIVPVINDTEKGHLVSCPNRRVVINWEMLCQDIFNDDSCPSV